ncbi:hypothetical protein HRbin34_00584 [bacterium HR34]|nr:hypothetical protein HRbin34_00584 [bacterium HR34]
MENTLLMLILIGTNRKKRNKAKKLRINYQDQ